MTPAEELKAAAAKLRELAAAMSEDYQGQWQTHTKWKGWPTPALGEPKSNDDRDERDGVFTEDFVDDVDTDAGSVAWHGTVAVVEDDSVRRWITALSPAVAEPLAAWLTLAGEDFRSREGLRKPGEPPREAWVNVIGYDPAPINLLSEDDGGAWQVQALRFARVINKGVTGD